MGRSRSNTAGTDRELYPPNIFKKRAYTSYRIILSSNKYRPITSWSQERHSSAIGSATGQQNKSARRNILPQDNYRPELVSVWISCTARRVQGALRLSSIPTDTPAKKNENYLKRREEKSSADKMLPDQVIHFHPGINFQLRQAAVSDSEAVLADPAWRISTHRHTRSPAYPDVTLFFMTHILGWSLQTANVLTDFVCKGQLVVL
ncbi:hypothetical protein J6590_050164 [Homalodisca vitripennis]|nr:hypothetical protein J6590_050164 [Homalodisca vitripennis]